MSKPTYSIYSRSTRRWQRAAFILCALAALSWVLTGVLMVLSHL